MRSTKRKYEYTKLEDSFLLVLFVVRTRYIRKLRKYNLSTKTKYCGTKLMNEVLTDNLHSNWMFNFALSSSHLSAFLTIKSSWDVAYCTHTNICLVRQLNPRLPELRVLLHRNGCSATKIRNYLSIIIIYLGYSSKIREESDPKIFHCLNMKSSRQGRLSFTYIFEWFMFYYYKFLAFHVKVFTRSSFNYSRGVQL